MERRKIQGRDVLKRACLSLYLVPLEYTSPTSVNLRLNAESSASALCSHAVHHVFILHLLIVGATGGIEAHLFSWNILRNGSPAASCW